MTNECSLCLIFFEASDSVTELSIKVSESLEPLPSVSQVSVSETETPKILQTPGQKRLKKEKNRLPKIVTQRKRWPEMFLLINALVTPHYHCMCCHHTRLRSLMFYRAVTEHVEAKRGARKSKISGDQANLTRSKGNLYKNRMYCSGTITILTVVYVHTYYSVPFYQWTYI